MGKERKRKVPKEDNPVEDKETPLENVEIKEADSDDEGDSDESSVYSELAEGEEGDESEEEESDGGEEESDDVENMSESSDEDGEKNDENGEKDDEDGEKDDEAKPGSSKVETSVNQNEYAYDSSDEEDIRNTIGNIPVNWYDEYPHIGYDLDGKQIRKPKRGDELDHFLSRMDNPEHGVTVRDPMTGQDVVLSEADVDIIKRLRDGKVPDASYDMYEDYVPWFSSEVLPTPVRDLNESKKSFLPSYWEKKKVGRMVHSIKMGWMKPRQKTTEEDEEKKFYMLWKTDDQPEDVKRINDTIPAPKMRLPGHAESYNPPPEYLFTEQEKKRWEEQDEEPYKRKLPFIPQKYSSLRKVPAYSRFINERFERCLDLYLAPRARKMRLTIQPEDLVPQLPKPQDLQPFPQTCSLTYKGHSNMIRTLSVEPLGQYIASGSDDGTIKIWEIQTGYCLKTFKVGGVVKSVAWCPSNSLTLIAAAVENKVFLFNSEIGDKVKIEQTTELLKDAPDNEGYIPPERVRTAVKWELPTKEDKLPESTLIVLKFFKPVKQVVWHGKGDYFATLVPEGQNRSVLIHQLSKWRSQAPFSKSKGLIQCILFHPIRPFFFVATQRHVRVYNLVKQEMSKKLMTGAKWISSLAIHPQGDNVLVGTYDKRVQWFDLDLSTMPYKVLRYHTNAVRSVAYHRCYPLFASASDDASIIVSHGMVYNDLLQNPFVVPLKQLRGHTKYDDFGVMDVIWHPQQPWLFSAGSDGYVKLWT